MKRVFWPILFYILVIVIVFGKALMPGATEMIWGDDIHHQYYFYRQFFNNFLAQGIWPWWNPYIFAGEPFMANPIVNIWYPPTWLFVVLPLNIAYSWHIAIHLLWAMLGMFVLLHCLSSSDLIRGSSLKQILDPRFRGDDASSFGPWIGGLIFGLSGFFTARIWAGHVDVIAAASWLPWVFGAFWQLNIDNNDRWTNFCHGGILSTSLNRRVVVAGGLFALQILAGYQTMAFFTAIAVFIVTLLLCYYVKSFKPLLFAGLAGLLGVGLAAIQIIPAQEFFRASIRTFALPYSWNSYGSLTIESLGQFLSPFFFGDQITYHGPPPNFAEHAFFVGRGTLLLLLVAIVVFLSRLPRLLTLPRSPMVFAFGFLALFGLWVSLGPNAPIDLQYILWKMIPMYHYLRIPPRHLILVAFGLSGIIGLSISYLSVFLSSRPLLRPSETLREGGSRDPVYNIFRFFPMLIVAFITIEMIIYARHFIVLQPLPETRHDAELLKILKQDREPYRVLTNFGAWIPPRDSFDFNAGMNYAIANATGYDPSILRTYYEFIDSANGNKPGASILDHDVQIPYLNVYSQATNTLNIKYILHPRAFDPLFGTKDPRFQLIREDAARDYRLYENTSALARFYFENRASGSATIQKYSPNEIVLTTSNTKGDTLASSEVYYPGWEGFIDGKKVEIMKVNNAFRALFVPMGNHTVIYRYNPRIFVIGGGISVLTVGLVIIFLNYRTFSIASYSPRATEIP